MSHPNPTQYDIQESNKTSNYRIRSVRLRYPWMNNANTMATANGRNCGPHTPIGGVSVPEQNQRRNALARFTVLSNGLTLYNYFPAANIPNDLPSDPDSLARSWTEKACKLAEKTQGDVQRAHRLITAAVLNRTGRAGDVMVSDDFIAARELAIMEDGWAQGMQQGLAQGRAQGRQEILQQLGNTEDDAIDIDDD